MELARKSVLFFLIPLFFSIPFAQASGDYSSDTTSIPVIAVFELPPEARDTLKLIKQGGPFPYPRDGVEFGNYERILPKQPNAYYHEYTVKTPGVRHRGARRIVCGIAPECYYTENHYRSFSRITEGR